MERGIGIAVLVFVLVAPQLVSGFWMDAILSQSFILGIGAASLVFLSAYGGMISLAQAGLMGIAGYALGNMVTERVEGGETKGLLLGWDPTVSVVAAILLTVGIGILFGAVASRSFGIYFLMLTLTYWVIAFLFVSQVTQVGGFSPIAGIDRYTPGFIGDVVNDRQRLYYVALGGRARRLRARSATSSGRRSGSRSRGSATSRRAWPRSATTSRSTARSPSGSAR